MILYYSFPFYLPSHILLPHTVLSDTLHILCDPASLFPYCGIVFDESVRTRFILVCFKSGGVDKGGDIRSIYMSIHTQVT